MHQTYSSEHSSGQSDSVPQTHAPVEEVPEQKGFEITLEDSNVLRQHLEEWKIANSAHRSKLYAKLMGELYQFRPVNTPFDKVTARDACWFSSYWI